MTQMWYLAVWSVARDASVLLGILIVVVGLLGRVDLSHPRCRRCKADLRPLAWKWAMDATAAHRATAACPNCGRTLTRRAVRWRPFPIRWRVVSVGIALIAIAIPVTTWSIARIHVGLTWRELVPAAWDAKKIQMSGYPEQPWVGIGPLWEWSSWWSSPWRSLNRRASAGLLTIEQLQSAAREIVRSMRDPTAPGTYVRGLIYPAPHADLLIEILHSNLGAELRRSAAAILMSPPGLTVVAVGDDPTVHSGDHVVVTLPTLGKGQQWGDHSQGLRSGPTQDQADRHRLDALCFVQEVLLDGVPIPFTTQSPADRSGNVAWFPYADEQGRERIPRVAINMTADAGTHEVAVVIDTAVVDYALSMALVASQGEVGPPERWGERTVVRRQVLRKSVVVVEPRVSDTGGQP